MRLLMSVFLCATAMISLSCSGDDESMPLASLEEIRELRLAGKLEDARSRADRRLEYATGKEDAIAVHLELAKIDDRIGLHNNSRPVAESLRNIEAAADLLSADEAHLAAEVQLAYGDYYYRAGMREREFSTATQHTSNAMEQFRAIGDFRGEADAVHRLGLIHLQQGELDRARELFDESLQLDREGGERVWFRGEYERHVGFLYQLSGDLEAALPHYERSLEARIAAQAIDASLFAALTLASAQLQLGNPTDARPHATYALCVAVTINSPEGTARAERLLRDIDTSLPGNEYATELLDC